ncbi:MAG: FtsX-like permease family protein [Nitrospirae bacterium]|nr:FtsX-like permease family protein [Candidatus Manganitrophaceae bacterium]
MSQKLTHAKNSPFVSRMIWREIRGAFRHFVFFLSSITIGVGAIVGVGNIAANFEAMTAHEAKNLLAADLEVRLTRPLSDAGEAVLSDLAQKGIEVVRVAEMVAMASNPETTQTQLVELKAVEQGYPFYGNLLIEPPIASPFKNENVVFVEEGLLLRLKLEVGDKLGLGDLDFTVAGLVKKEPDKVAGPFSLGPRVLISQDVLTQTALVKVGSRIRRRLLLKTTALWPPEKLKTHLIEIWKDESVQVKTYREVRPRLRRFLENFTTYLGVVGLITLLIGGMGVGGNVHAFLTERMQSIAILKSLGASSVSILKIYLGLTLLLGSVGGVIGVALGVGIYQILGHLLSDFLPPGFHFELFLAPIFQGLSMGLLTALLFSIWPLRVVGEVSPAGVFRQAVEGIQERSNKGGLAGRLCLITVLVLAWLGLTVWQAGSWKLGSSVAAGLAGAILLLLLSGRIMLFCIKRMKTPRNLSLRYGISNLYRPGQQVQAVLLSLGIAVMVLLTLKQVEKNLMVQLENNIPEAAPGLFLIDIQSDQQEKLMAILEKWNLKQPTTLTPLIRSRLHAIEGDKISEMSLEGRRDRWYFTREYVLTYQEDLPLHNVLARGLWWGAEPDERTEMLSVEAEAAKNLGLDLGSEVSFDIQGVPISGKISSVRDVDWGSMTTNFYFIFPPEALAGAPETFVATVTADEADDGAIQNAVIDAFPNITIIPIREIIETIGRILQEVARTVEFMAMLAMTVGLVVVSGAIAATRGRRVHELVLFKILGATRPTLMAMMAVEYAILGLLAALVGGGLSVLSAWVIVHYFLKIPWQFAWEILFLGGLATVCLTVLTGFFVSYRTLGEKPLVALRTE